MNKVDLNIDKRQVIILVVGIAMVISLFIYWQFFYAPKRQEVSAIYSKVKDFDVNIQEEQVRIQAQGYEQEIAKMQQEVGRLQEKFPSSNELPGLYQELYVQADKFKVEIVSLEPDKPSVYQVQFPEKNDLIFNRVPIHLHMRASYRALAEFLQKLFDNAQYAFSFDELKIKKLAPAESQEDIAQKLDIDMLVGAFVLSREGAAPLDQQELQKTFELNLRGKN
jgi:Tfp pilus assembly protein PilO